MRTPVSNAVGTSHSGDVADSSDQAMDAHTTVHSTVVTLLRNWLHLAKSGQDTRVAHCAFTTLEDYHQKLCVASNRDYARRSFRSKQVHACEISDIFRSSVRGMLGELTERASQYTLPFVRDYSFRHCSKSDLHSLMIAAFAMRIDNADAKKKKHAPLHHHVNHRFPPCTLPTLALALSKTLVMMCVGRISFRMRSKCNACRTT